MTEKDKPRDKWKSIVTGAEPYPEEWLASEKELKDAQRETKEALNHWKKEWEKDKS